jgi:drug/metabolite transporter (DMT)-like permease
MIPLVLYGTFFGGSQTAVNFSKEANATRWLDWKNWMNLIFLGLGASALAFAAWNKVCGYIGTVRATVGIYLIPVVTIIFAFFALNEKIMFMGGIGALLTIIGLFISECKMQKSAKSDK